MLPYPTAFEPGDVYNGNPGKRVDVLACSRSPRQLDRAVADEDAEQARWAADARADAAEIGPARVARRQARDSRLAKLARNAARRRQSGSPREQMHNSYDHHYRQPERGPLPAGSSGLRWAYYPPASSASKTRPALAGRAA